MESQLQNIAYFIQDKVKGQIKDNDYIKLMIMISKVYVGTKKENDYVDDCDNSYNDDYISSYT